MLSEKAAMHKVLYAIGSDHNLGEAVEGVAVLGVVVLGVGVGGQRELHDGYAACSVGPHTVCMPRL
jgi:hypothetical protein